MKTTEKIYCGEWCWWKIHIIWLKLFYCCMIDFHLLVYLTLTEVDCTNKQLQKDCAQLPIEHMLAGNTQRVSITYLYCKQLWLHLERDKGRKYDLFFLLPAVAPSAWAGAKESINSIACFSFSSSTINLPLVCNIWNKQNNEYEVRKIWVIPQTKLNRAGTPKYQYQTLWCRWGSPQKNGFFSFFKVLGFSDTVYRYLARIY